MSPLQRDPACSFITLCDGCTLTAGVVYIAGQSISTTTSVQININTKVNFKGGIAGDALVLNYFLLNN